MGGMGSLYIGASGLQTSQNALNTTAHNLANVSTEGYVRQLVIQTDKGYTTVKNGDVVDSQVGSGTTLAQVYQCRDGFLDQSYRLEVGRQSFYETGYSSYYEVETLFGETEGVEFQDALENLRTAFEELQKTPDDSIIQTNLKQQAVEFIEAAKAIYDELASYQESLNDQVIDTVDQVNELAQTIYSLNQQIVQVESGGVENANDLRDQRNTALDELSEIMNISYSEDSSGAVIVKAEGVPLVTESNVYEMSYTVDTSTGFATPVWADFGNMQVYNMSQEISSDTNTDVGSLRSLLLQRGDGEATYMDLPQESDYTDEDGNWLKSLEGWDINGTTYYYGKEAYEAATEYYNTYLSGSSITSTMAQLDTLINGIITSVNDLLCPNTETTLTLDITDEDGNVISAGSVVTILDMGSTSYGADGSVGTELFSRSGMERYTVYTDSSANEYYVYNEEDASNQNSLYTVSNLEVKDEILKDVSKLPLIMEDGSVDYDRAEALLELWNEGFATLDPDATVSYTFENFYTAMIGDMATNESVYSALADTAASTVTSVDNSRQQVMGVSSDEELTNMIRFQNAYNAASRYINVVDDMLELIVTQLGA